MNTCDTCLVRNRAICSVLDRRGLDDFNRIGRRRKIKAGETLFWEGDDAIIVGSLIDGILKQTKSAQGGREQIVGLNFPSDFVGKLFGAEGDSSVTALTDAELCVFTRSSFGQFSQSHPELVQELLKRTVDELTHAREWMLLLGRKSASEKVASLLLEISERLGGRDCATSHGPLNRFELPVSRRQIADILGLTIETVSRQLGALRDCGVIMIPARRTIEIVDREALAFEAEKDG